MPGTTYYKTGTFQGRKPTHTVLFSADPSASNITDIRQTLASSNTDIRQTLTSNITDVRQTLASNITDIRQTLASNITDITVDRL